MKLLDKINAAITPATDARTTPSPELGSADPNVNTAGAGESPIEPENLNPPGVPAVNPTAPPIVSTDPGYIPPGAPTTSRQVAPVQDLGARTYALAAAMAAPLQIAPGWTGARRVIVTVLADVADLDDVAAYLAPDQRQDTSGARLAPNQPYVFHTGAPLWLINAGSAAGAVSVINEPSAG